MAIVTGASQGIGAGIAHGFIGLGYGVVATAVTRSLATEFAARGVRVNAVAAGL